MCVLVVEDELLIRMGIAILLEDAGHDVLSAHDGADAIDLATRNPGRLTAVVTDHHMPGRTSSPTSAKATPPSPSSSPPPLPPSSPRHGAQSTM